MNTDSDTAGLFLSSNVFRNTFQWTILVQYEIGFWTAAMTVWLWISGENEPMWRVRPISCWFSFLGQHYRCCYRDVLRLVSSRLFGLDCGSFLDLGDATDHIDRVFCQRSAVSYMCLHLKDYNFKPLFIMQKYVLQPYAQISMSYV